MSYQNKTKSKRGTMFPFDGKLFLKNQCSMAGITLKMLAKELNISTSTVSRAIKDGHDISPKTKQEVLELAKKWNYQPNPHASSLRGQSSKTIAVVIPEIANNFFSLAINGIQSVAQQKDYHVLIYLTHESFEQERSIIQHLQSGRVDGILMSLSSETTDTTHLTDLKDKGLPIIFFDRVYEHYPTVKVTTNDYESSFKATEHLIEQGCSKIAYLLVSQNLSIGINRMNGYLDAIRKNGIEPDHDYIIHGSNDRDKNYALIEQLLTSKNRPDGIFASVEKMAITCYQVCQDHNLSIPSDVKILSFSNLETAPFFNPSLTTITQPAYEIGKKSASMLLCNLHKRNQTLNNETIVLESMLIKRNSTAML
jgi:LacI family transcriptional regulator